MLRASGLRLLVPARQLATATAAPTAKPSGTKPPIRVFGVSGRYAEALYSAALSKGGLDKAEGDLDGVLKLAGESERFREFMQSPIIQRKDKMAGIEALLRGKTSDIVTNFFVLLAENNRLGEARSIADAFKSIMRAHRGEVECHVTTARQLDAAALKRLEEALKGFVRPNEKLHTHIVVDPTIVGGMVVEIGDNRIDMSIGTRVKKMANLLSESL